MLVVEPSPFIQLQFPYSIVNTAYVTSTTASGGTVTAGPAASATANLVSLTTTTTSGSSAIINSNRRLHYHPGQGAVCEFTAIYATGTANNNQIAGIGNAQDGFFYGYNGTAFGILNRSSASGSLVDTWIPQTTWNVDTMDGTGSSGVTLNPQDGNVYKIQFQWLGFGVINFFIENPNDGTWILVHRISRANGFTTTSLLNPSMQLYAQNINTGTATGNTLKICCMSALIEGQDLPANDVRNAAFSASKTIPISGSSPNSIIAIRNNSTYNSVTNQVMVYVDQITALNTSGGTVPSIISLYYNPTITSSTFANAIGANSVVNWDSAGTSVTAGTQIASFYIFSGTTFAADLTTFGIVLNPGDTLCIAAVSTGASGTAQASLSWHEEF